MPSLAAPLSGAAGPLEPRAPSVAPTEKYVGVGPEAVLERITAGMVTNVRLGDLVGLLEALGFQQLGGRGSHRVFGRPGVRRLVNLQIVGGQAKPYQVRQVVALIRRYDLNLESER
jgi:predicted RNA binding protein YcfA (HicA-like mRNA interferase family)